MKSVVPLLSVLRVLRAAMVLALAGSAALVHAQAEPELRALALDWAREAAHAGAAQGPSLRLEVQVGALDARLKLAPCAQVEPYLPPGARLWGRSRVGLRCTDGMSRWNVSLPLTVRAYGPAWVVRTQVAAGAPITEQDAVQAEVDWAEEPSPVLADLSSWLGQIATRPLQTGQVLRQGMLKPAVVFQAGAPVRVVAQGPGFQVSGDGQALSAGVVGQSARIRLDNGRVTSGTVVDARTVRIDI